MAVEITPMVGCDRCGAAKCPRCLGCPVCTTYARGCVCPPPEIRSVVRHEAGEGLTPHRCEPRILMTCSRCRRELGYCMVSPTAVESLKVRRWACPECLGGAAA